TFTTADWATPQPVTVAAAHDVDTTDDEATLEVTANLATPHTVEVSVNDDDPLAPVISSEPVTTATEDAPYQYDVEATGTPTPTYSLTTSPGGMTIDANTGIIAWTPTSTGSFPVTVLASNGVAPNDEQSFAIEVSVDLPPNCTLTRPTPGEIVQGTGAEFYGDGTDDVGTVSAEFSIDAVLDYTDINSAGHYHFGGSHVLWDTTQYSDGLHTVRMTVYDTSGQSCFVEVDVTIANSALPDAGTQDAGTQPEAGTSEDAGTDPDGVDASFPMDAAAFDAALGLDAEIPDVDALDASVASDATAPDPSDTDATMTNPPIVDPLDAASGGVGGSSNSTTDAALPAADSSVEQSGCGCSTPGTPTRSRDLGLCVALLALALRVRRRSS
ncbi:MAG TPA: Ig domain-containing protein, partial [Polyangiaceae bacterium]|nr:Ig domain-containing protein [Polyangiaceae bacterium]